MKQPLPDDSLTMKVEQIYTGCLAQGTYYIVSDGEAAIIDPLREIQPYLDRAAADGVTIKYIFETHFHADFVSGHVDLGKHTGAPIVYGPTANPGFNATIATDGQTFRIGKVTITTLHTPGHTPESTTWLLRDEQGKDYALFTGDTLFLGDVGRPDLAQKAAEMTVDDLAGMLYDSLMNKIMPLSDDLLVYPAHGAGSACGKNMMKETVDTLGNQKKINYALRQPDKSSFIKAVTEGLQAPPAYFPMNVAMNKEGYQAIDEVMKKGLTPLTPDQLEETANITGALILDTRDAGRFAAGFIPGSLSIGLNGDFAPWTGAIIGDVNIRLLLVADPGREEESVIRLARVGFDHVMGFLEGGYESWVKAGKPTDNIQRITAQEFAEMRDNNQMPVLDLRTASEYESQHLEWALHRPLSAIREWMPGLPATEPFFIHCQSGYRSIIAASMLKAYGYRHFTEITDGFAGILKTKLPTTDFVCTSQIPTA